jgi:Amt family ammonium transporter
VHLVGGLVGTIAIGFLATSGGLLYGGGAGQLVVQTAVALFAMLWSGAVTLVVGLALQLVMGWRVEDEHELDGIDFAQHGETAYEFAPRGRGRLDAGLPGEAPAARVRSGERALA